MSSPAAVLDAPAVPFRDLLAAPDRVRYLVWHLLGQRRTLQCRLKSGVRLSIRGRPSPDWETAYEVFRLRSYATGLPAEGVRRVVDLGGNVGYSCLYWCQTYPQAEVVTFEPHPEHCDRLRWHVDVNGYGDRVRVVGAAAATHAAVAHLSDAGIQSRVLQDDLDGAAAATASAPEGAIAIELVDFFQTVGEAPIDILKIDIEGGEYALLADPRFPALAQRVGCVVMEWHQRAPAHRGGAWCEAQLTAAGFAIARRWSALETPDIGNLLAFRR